MHGIAVTSLFLPLLQDRQIAETSLHAAQTAWQQRAPRARQLTVGAARHNVTLSPAKRFNREPKSPRNPGALIDIRDLSRYIKNPDDAEANAALGLYCHYV